MAIEDKLYSQLSESNRTKALWLFWQAYFYDKDVVLIGGGEHYPKVITHDKIVVGTNANWTKYNRCNVLFSNGEHNPAALKLPIIKPKMVFLKHWSTFNMNNWYHEVKSYSGLIIRYDSYPQKLGIINPNTFWLNDLYDFIQTLPLTGIVALAFLKHMPIKSCQVLGFDFYGGREKLGGHKIHIQQKWYIENIVKDKRFILT